MTKYLQANTYYAVTSGSSYLDMDAYACCVALAELLRRKGENAVAVSNAVCNYSVCRSLIREGQIRKTLPAGTAKEEAEYILVDVSDPDFIRGPVPLDRVVEVYDHHTGFEDYWHDRIGENAHIEFIGAAATQIYREWKKSGLVQQMSRESTLLLVAAILDNTLNLTASNTTAEDVEAFRVLCQKEQLDAQWCAAYFSEVQDNIASNFREALLKDVKTLQDNDCLPATFAQLCVWDSSSVIAKLEDIRQWLDDRYGDWFVNIIDIQRQYSCFVCKNPHYQKKIASIFHVCFEDGVAKTTQPYLRKQIIKKTKENKEI